MVRQAVDFVRKYAEEILRLTKVVSIFASLAGAYYFASYLYAFRIPFPLDLAVLPVALLAIGVIAVIITAIIIAYISILGWAQTDPFDLGYAELIHSDRKGVYYPNPKVALINIGAIFIFPFAFWVAIIILTPRGMEDLFFYALMVSYAVWSIAVGAIKANERPHQSSKAYLAFAAKVSAFTFGVAFFTLVASLIYIALLSTRGFFDTNVSAVLSLMVFAAINITMLYPYLNVRGFDEENRRAIDRGGSLSPKILSKRIHGSGASIVIVILVGVTLFQPFSAFIGELPLRLVGLAPIEARTLHTSEKTASSWPAGLIGDCEGTRCSSVPLQVVLDLGRTLYVRKVSESKFVFRLERSDVVDRLPSGGQVGHGQRAEKEEAQQGAGADGEDAAAQR